MFSDLIIWKLKNNICLLGRRALREESLSEGNRGSSEMLVCEKISKINTVSVCHQCVCGPHHCSIGVPHHL